MRQKALRFVLPCLLLALTASAPEPGGWALITVEDLPDHLVAGTPLELTYTVRQHGQTLRSGLDGEVLAFSGDELIEVTARPGDHEGEYKAVVTVPEPGLWTVTIRSQFIQGFPGMQESKLLPIEAVREGEEPRRALSDAERGRRLFVAKGCVTCHSHRAVPDARSSPLGPDLTGRHYATDYLAMYLADPSIRPATEPTPFPMPDLDLDRAEIAGLTAFINADVSAEVGSQKPR